MKNDWTQTVKNDLETLGLGTDLNKFSTIKREVFAKIVKKSIKSRAFEELMGTKDFHSKMDGCKYKELKMQSYLCDKNINEEQAKQIFRLRTRMAMVSTNFKTSQANFNCPLCEKSGNIT